MSNKILITGADGQLGRAFKNVYPDAVFVDREQVDFCAPIWEIREKIKKHEPEVVINCAAYTQVDKAEQESALAGQVNALAVTGVAEACRDLGALLVQVSTEYVFTGSKNKSHNEDDPAFPGSVYGLTKQLGEQAALAYENSMVVRTSWLYGEGNNFVKTMLRLSESMDEISVVDDQIGRPTYAKDLAEVIEKLIEKYEPNGPRIFHVQNSGEAISWAEFAEKIFEIADKNTKVKKISTEEYLSNKKDALVARRPKYSVLEMKNLESLGIKVRSWEEGLEEYLKELT